MGTDMPAEVSFPRHVGEKLDDMPDHRTRARFCLLKAERLRNQYYDMQMKFVDATMKADDPTLQGQSEATRQLIGQRRWSNEFASKDLVAREQMWARWAQMYATFAMMERMI